MEKKFKAGLGAPSIPENIEASRSFFPRVLNVAGNIAVRVLPFVGLGVLSLAGKTNNDAYDIKLGSYEYEPRGGGESGGKFVAKIDKINHEGKKIGEIVVSTDANLYQGKSKDPVHKSKGREVMQFNEKGQMTGYVKKVDMNPGK